MKKIIYALLAFSPVMALAQGTTNAGDLPVFTRLAQTFANVIKILIPAMLGLAIVYFFYGLAKYILAGASDPKAHDAGKQIMIWGLVAIFIMVSLYGIIGFVQTQLGINGTAQNNPITLPTVNGLQ